MRELITVKSYEEFVHRPGSRYEITDYSDDGMHMTYTEIDKNGFGHHHQVRIKEREEWDKLCEMYPMYKPTKKK